LKKLIPAVLEALSTLQLGAIIEIHNSDEKRSSETLNQDDP
jgi:hypothetical protein